jgi:tRNA-dihydrouridine synthase A
MLADDGPSMLENRVKHRFSVAPMMDYTDRYQRYLHRLLSQQAVLYTEMVTASAIIHRHRNNEQQRDLEPNDPIEEPVVLQLGGSDPSEMRAAAKIAADNFG